MAFEVGVEIVTIVIAWKSSVLEFHFKITQFVVPFSGRFKEERSLSNRLQG